MATPPLHVTGGRMSYERQIAECDLEISMLDWAEARKENSRQLVCSFYQGASIQIPINMSGEDIRTTLSIIRQSLGGLSTKSLLYREGAIAQEGAYRS